MRLHLKLTNYQKEFILLNFFKNEEYAGWKNIGTKLLETGKCIVPGYKCIWSGGIGNFIKTTKSEEAIDCLVYTFDLGEFINSKWFEEITDIYTSELWAKKMAIDCEYYELKDLPMYILE